MKFLCRPISLNMHIHEQSKAPSIVQESVWVLCTAVVEGVAMRVVDSCVDTGTERNYTATRTGEGGGRVGEREGGEDGPDGGSK